MNNIARKFQTLFGGGVAMARPKDIPIPANAEKAVFGMGCFWGPDGQFPGVKGVLRTQVGYAGGQTKDPNYQNIGDHTEVIEVEFDPSQTDYNKMLDTFWQLHDGTSRMHKRQYISLILYANEQQQKAAEASKAAQPNAKSLVTEIRKLDHFYPAEGYHQKYHLQHNREIMAGFGMTGQDMFTSSLAAQLSAFVNGHGSERQLAMIKTHCDINEQQENLLEDLINRSGSLGGQCGI